FTSFTSVLSISQFFNSLFFCGIPFPSSAFPAGTAFFRHYPAHNRRYSTAEEQKRVHRNKHRKIGSGDFQRIPAEPFCYCSAQTDPGQVPEKNLALVFLCSHINKKNKKQEQIPDACVQKKRVGLNVYGISNCNKMLLKPSREQTLRNN